MKRGSNSLCARVIFSLLEATFFNNINHGIILLVDHMNRSFIISLSFFNSLRLNGYISPGQILVLHRAFINCNISARKAELISSDCLRGDFESSITRVCIEERRVSSNQLSRDERVNRERSRHCL